MKKYKCTVARTDEYIIEFDENVINDEWMLEFQGYMYDFDTLEEHAEHIAQHRARFQVDFIEGYGVPYINGKEPFVPDYYKKSFEPAINIKIISEDKDCNVEVEEIK